MASQDYHRGEMDIHDQKATWGGFITGGTWGALILLMTIGYAVLAVAIGLHWMVSLGLMAATGIGAGLFLKLGGRWMATVVVLIALALVVQGFIWLFNVLL